MVLHKFGEKLYNGLVATMTSHLKEISKSIEAAQGDSFLEELNRKWNDHNKALQMIRDIDVYGQDMLMDLGSSVYQEDFEKPFLEVSAEFYSGESQKFIECCDCGLVNMLLDDKFDDLGRMYNLFRRVPDGLSTIREVMTSHLRETGKQLVSDPERLKDPVEFVQCLLDEKDNSFHCLWMTTLRKGLKGVSEEDVEIILDKVMMHIPLFCRRRCSLKSFDNRGLGPLTLVFHANLPAEMSALCEKFRFLLPLGTHTGRRLSWQTNNGLQADIKATFGKGQKHELNVSTYQMCVLMLFNNADRRGYKEIEQATEIPTADLKGEDRNCSAQKESELKAGDSAESRGGPKPQIEAAVVRIMKSRRLVWNFTYTNACYRLPDHFPIPDRSYLK
ncbi:hypothetical protein POTOM_030150 [Populus tomentosa]|uniref:Cullin family profile domain-containing protein n=1 Tax=Populus tomentosa TaxID=118781 RepID=A0A8X8CTP2_POPTO|nr:hypothetical protein POTOM_030150 [Populus tomentosa]